MQQLAIEHPVADRIIEYRELTKLRGTYIDGLLKLITDEGRIHSTLQQTRAATGRLSSDSPNLQNIPVRTEMGVRIRDAFTASPGRRLVVADYSQIELRILAHMTGEPALVESFASGEDIHTRTASEVFDVRMESVTPELRRRAKMVNFGILYGISGFGLATRLGNVHPAEAERYIKRYFERYPKVTEFMQETLAGGRGPRVFHDALREAALRTRARELQQEREEAGGEDRLQRPRAGDGGGYHQGRHGGSGTQAGASRGRHDHAGPRRARLRRGRG